LGEYSGIFKKYIDRDRGEKMIYKINDICHKIEELAPIELAEKWDNVGLMVGNRESGVRKVFLCLDITAKLLDEAIENDVQLVITHHPLIFDPLKSIDEQTPVGAIIQKLIRNNISVYSAHTNLDMAQQGINNSLAKALTLIKTSNTPDGYGLTGFLPQEMEPNIFLEFVSESLNTSRISHTIVTPKHKINKVAAYCGHFSGNINTLADVDAIVSSEIKHSDALLFQELGILAVDAGHFPTEYPGLKRLYKILRSEMPEVDFILSNKEYDVFYMLRR
jgi:dinuclear metal center YbgI/SA1388 family protein